MARISKAAQADQKALWAAALEGLEMQRRRIEDQIAQVRQMLGARGPGRPPAAAVSAGASGSPVKRARRKRILSPEARKRIAAAQKKRWAEFRKAQAAGANE